jgi:hypothetical protein
MVASIKPHRDEIGLSDGLLLIDGSWAAGGEATPRRVTWTGHLPRTRMTRVGYRRAGGSGIARSESLWSGCKTRGSPWRSAVKQEATEVPQTRHRLNLQPSGWRARQTLEPHAAFGGHGQLGMGREGGRTAIAA